MNRTIQKNRGFSLFEMIVVLAIISYVATVTFSSFPKMNSKLSLDLLTQDVALTIRQAQIYGTTVFGELETGPNTATANFQAYGVSFPSVATVGADGKYKYTLFADIPLPGEKYFNETGAGPTTKNTYNELSGSSPIICMNEPTSCNLDCGNPTLGNECLQRFNVSGRDQVSALCLNYLTASNADGKKDSNRVAYTKDIRVANCKISKTQPCSVINVSNQYTLSPVDIVFRRPRLQAVITTKCSSEYFSPTNVGIVVESDSGETRVVVVWENGQISIDR